MSDSWATFGADLHLDMSGPRLRAGLMTALRDAVRSGRLAPGARLPSSRSLAADLGIARNTVADAYAELVAEGWLTARQGSGTRVAPRPAARTAPPAPAPTRGRPERERPAHSLMPGRPDVASFPRAAWLKAARRALTAVPDDAFGYGDPRGRPELRTALADYLARARGVHATPERILICSGFVHGLSLVGRTLARRGVRRAAVESYGLDIHWNLLAQAGLALSPLPFDAAGTRPEAPGALHGAGAVLMTPAHQFPLGVPLSPTGRAAAVDWARRTGGLVLEDDYDGEFRYDRQPVGALQGLDPDRVVYFGTASKSLAPGLRLAWMVLPEPVVGEVLATSGGEARLTGVTDQLTLAEFLTSGAYDRHVRAMRLRYRRRRDDLVDRVRREAPHVRVSGIAAGLHAVLELPPGGEASALRAAAWHGLQVEGLGRYRHPDALPGGPEGLVVGYGTPSDSSWNGTLDVLCHVLRATG
ncbi:PLP-dependent aminotransferase family protein [Streptomyces genisteinicus]|uniref:PLP-dependent aminotransferase family protein n=1 Tax=Streptomyces genisteinicus TaxID=2768068 RepID=A0A7H0HWE7_9ACTN|nr:PLP-dependent aminotransferase family protein [Streptomyces genisteinicus]QNP64863.1 PLP-dependent aminotransferase family protein [Streptomyces genisteinicus]